MLKKSLLLILLSFSLFASEKDYKIGETLFNKTCISCHGKDGNGNPMLHLVVMPRALNKSILNEKQSYLIIKNGSHYWGSLADIMPSFQSVFNDKELRSIAYYISKKFNPNVNERVEKLYKNSDTISKIQEKKMLKRGAKIYKRNCRWCHGLTAKGDGEATKNPEKSIYPYNLRKTLLTDKQMFLYAKYGGKYWGTYKDDMPSWSRKYDDFTLKSVIKYVEKEFRAEYKSEL